MINLSLIGLLVTPRRSKEERVLHKFGQNLGKNGVFNKKIPQDFVPRDLLTCCYYVFFFWWAVLESNQ